MTPQETNEAVARKLGVYPKEETIVWAKSQVTGAGQFKIIVPDYCHNIAAAQEVIVHLCKTGKPPILWYTNDGKCCISFKYDEMVTDILPPPMAICVAFLKTP